MTARTHLIEGEGAPTTTPPSIGVHYIDTTSGDQYLSTGTWGVTDWRLLVQVSPGHLSAADSGTYIIRQTTRSITAELYDGPVSLELDHAMMQGTHIIELWLDGDHETPHPLYIQSPENGTEIGLGNQSIQGYAVASSPGAHGLRWQLTPGPVSWLWVRLLVVDGEVHLLEQAAD